MWPPVASGWDPCTGRGSSEETRLLQALAVRCPRLRSSEPTFATAPARASWRAGTAALAFARTGPGPRQAIVSLRVCTPRSLR